MKKHADDMTTFGDAARAGIVAASIKFSPENQQRANLVYAGAIAAIIRKLGVVNESMGTPKELFNAFDKREPDSIPWN